MRYPFKALLFIVRHPSVWPLCLLPILINTVLIILVWRWTGGLADEWLRTHLQGDVWYWKALHTGAVVVAFVLRMLIAIASFVIFGNLAALPFNDLLSERVDKLLGWRDERGLSWWARTGEFAKTVVQELLRITVYGLGMLALIILSFVPLMTPFAAAGQFLLSAQFLALDYMSYPLERRGFLLLKEKLEFSRAHARESLFFGAAVALVGFIPLVNCLFIPLGVVGGTLLHSDLTGGAVARVPAR
jgi:CysZ protein